MAYIIACLMASLSFLLNRMLLKLIGNITIITLSPVIEETSKTLLSFYLGADIMVTHAVFGVIEAIYDWQGAAAKIRAAVYSVIGHCMFGFITIVGLHFSLNVWLGLAGAIIAHLVWNYSVVQFSQGGSKT